MEVLASMLGPSTEKEPARKGTGKMDSPPWRLDDFIGNALGVVVSNVSPQRGLQSVRGGFTALDRFNEIRFGVSRSKSVDESNF